MAKRIGIKRLDTVFATVYTIMSPIPYNKQIEEIEEESPDEEENDSDDDGPEGFTSAETNPSKIYRNVDQDAVHMAFVEGVADSQDFLTKFWGSSKLPDGITFAVIRKLDIDLTSENPAFVLGDSNFGGGEKLMHDFAFTMVAHSQPGVDMERGITTFPHKGNVDINYENVAMLGWFGDKANNSSPYRIGLRAGLKVPDADAKSMGLTKMDDEKFFMSYDHGVRSHCFNPKSVGKGANGEGGTIQTFSEVFYPNFHKETGMYRMSNSHHARMGRFFRDHPWLTKDNITEQLMRVPGTEGEIEMMIGAATNPIFKILYSVEPKAIIKAGVVDGKKKGTSCQYVMAPKTLTDAIAKRLKDDLEKMQGAQSSRSLKNLALYAKALTPDAATAKWRLSMTVNVLFAFLDTAHTMDGKPTSIPVPSNYYNLRMLDAVLKEELTEVKHDPETFKHLQGAIANSGM